MKKFKILLVDDEAALTKLVSINLRNTGMYEVKISNQPTEVSGLIESFVPDVIVLDILMPWVDGLELCKIIRNSNCVPIVMLSGMDGPEERKLAKEMGANGFLAKPVDMKQLITVLQGILLKEPGV